MLREIRSLLSQANLSARCVNLCNRQKIFPHCALEFQFHYFTRCPHTYTPIHTRAHNAYKHLHACSHTVKRISNDALRRFGILSITFHQLQYLLPTQQSLLVQCLTCTLAIFAVRLLTYFSKSTNFCQNSHASGA